MKHKIVSRCTQGAFRYQAWPTVAKGEDGTLYVGTSGHRLNHICPFGKNLMYVSHDEGETWSAPMIVNDTWLDDRDMGLLAWGDGNLLMTSFDHPPANFDEWEADGERRERTLTTPLAKGMREMWKSVPEDELVTGSYTRFSADFGKTWSEPNPAPVSSPHGPCLLSDGNLFFVGTFVATGGEYESAVKEERIQGYKSHDNGKTWELVSILPFPEEGKDGGVYEPHAIQMQNGDILAAVRHEPSHPPVMKNLKIYTTLSHDGGKTWEKPVFLDLCGAPPHLLQHSSGAVVMVYSRRREPMGQYARVSFDFGKTWSKDVCISCPEPADWDHGYPSSVELSNGDILTVYYQKCEGDDYASLHSVRWNLSEIE